MEQHAAEPEPMGTVTRGMPVVDASGLPLGTVVQVRRGDPDAVAVQSPAPDVSGTLDDLVRATARDEPHVPAEAAARLLRRGYLKVDTGRAGEEPLYIEADLVDRVQDDRVRLSVLAASLTSPG